VYHGAKVTEFAAAPIQRSIAVTLASVNYKLGAFCCYSAFRSLNKYQLSLTKRATRCITANVLQTNIDAHCDKLATELKPWFHVKIKLF